MKNNQAQFIEDVTYKVVMPYDGGVDTQYVDIKRVFFNSLPDGDDWEFIYAMQDEFEAILKLKCGKSMPFQPCRDSEDWGVIVRVK